MELAGRIPIVDFHTHILPGVDDGAKDVQTTKHLLDLSAEMGIDGLVATPHFYADESRLEDFLRKREAAVQEMLTVYDSAAHPKIYLGAEVSYFYGIGTSKDIRPLAIQGTDLILIEMPYMPWDERMLDELAYIKKELRLTPVIAHVERYWKLQSRRILGRLMDLDVRLQFSAGFLADSDNKRLINKLIVKNALHFLGSDCHNTSTRPQNLPDAVAALIKHPKGEAALCKIAGYSEQCLTCGYPIADHNRAFEALSC